MAQLKHLIVSGAARVQGTVYADSFVGNVSGTSSQATSDSIGNNISSTYIKSLSIDSNNRLVATKGNNTDMTPIELPIPTINSATDQAAGITKIYSSVGNNTDGTMTQAAITTAIGNINQFNIAVVNTLPTTDIDDHTIYLVPNSGSGTNVKDEYIYVNNNWEKIGSTDIDLTPYATTAEVADLPYVSGITQSGSTLTVTTNDSTTPTTNSLNVGVTSITAGTGLTGGTISATGTIALDDSGVTAGTYGPSADVTGSEGNTIKVPKFTVDEYGRVTNVVDYTLTNKDTTYQSGTGVTIDSSDNSINLTSGVVTAGTKGPTANVTGSEGNTIKVPKVTVDEYGRVTALSEYTLTNKDTTYSSGTGVTVDSTNNSINLTSGVVTAGSAGPTADVTGNDATTIKVPAITVDGYGRVTALSEYTLTNKDTTYTPAKLGFGYGTCSTAEATTAKAATLSNYVLTTGGIVSIKFTNAVPASSTLNINTKGAKAIYLGGSAITDGVIDAGAIATFIYDGSHYCLIACDVLDELVNDYGNEDA